MSGNKSAANVNSIVQSLVIGCNRSNELFWQDDLLREVLCYKSQPLMDMLYSSGLDGKGLGNNDKVMWLKI